MTMSSDFTGLDRNKTNTDNILITYKNTVTSDTDI